MSGSGIRGGERLRMPMLFWRTKGKRWTEKVRPEATNNGLLNQAYSFVFLKSLEKSPKTKEKRVDAGLKL